MVIIDRKEIGYGEWRTGDLCLADLASDASDLTDLPDLSARLMVVACHDILCAVWHKLDDMVRTDCRALSTAYARFLIHHDIPIAVLRYSADRTYGYAGTEMETAFLAGIWTTLQKSCSIAVRHSLVLIVRLRDILSAAAEDECDHLLLRFDLHSENLSHLRSKGRASG